MPIAHCNKNGTPMLEEGPFSTESGQSCLPGYVCFTPKADRRLATMHCR